MSAKELLKSQNSSINISEICSNVSLKDGMLSEGAMEGCLRKYRKKGSRRRQQHLKWQGCHKESTEGEGVLRQQWGEELGDPEGSVKGGPQRELGLAMEGLEQEAENSELHQGTVKEFWQPLSPSPPPPPRGSSHLIISKETTPLFCSVLILSPTPNELNRSLLFLKLCNVTEFISHPIFVRPIRAESLLLALP